MTTMECLKHPRWFYHKRETEELKIQLGFVKQQQIKEVHQGGVKYSITAECDIETIKKATANDEDNQEDKKQR